MKIIDIAGINCWITKDRYQLYKLQMRCANEHVG